MWGMLLSSACLVVPMDQRRSPGLLCSADGLHPRRQERRAAERAERRQRREQLQEQAALARYEASAARQQPRRQVGGGSRARAAADANRPRSPGNYAWLKVGRSRVVTSDTRRPSSAADRAYRSTLCTHSNCLKLRRSLLR
jgi:hypothetical protein